MTETDKAFHTINSDLISESKQLRIEVSSPMTEPNYYTSLGNPLKNDTYGSQSNIPVYIPGKSFNRFCITISPEELEFTQGIVFELFIDEIRISYPLHNFNCNYSDFNICYFSCQENKYSGTDENITNFQVAFYINENKYLVIFNNIDCDETFYESVFKNFKTLLESNNVVFDMFIDHDTVISNSAHCLNGIKKLDTSSKTLDRTDETEEITPEEYRFAPTTKHKTDPPKNNYRQFADCSMNSNNSLDGLLKNVELLNSPNFKQDSHNNVDNTETDNETNDTEELVEKVMNEYGVTEQQAIAQLAQWNDSIENFTDNQIGEIIEINHKIEDILGNVAEDDVVNMCDKSAELGIPETVYDKGSVIASLENKIIDVTTQLDKTKFRLNELETSLHLRFEQFKKGHKRNFIDEFPMMLVIGFISVKFFGYFCSHVFG